MAITFPDSSRDNPFEFFDYIFSNEGQQKLMQAYLDTINQNEFFINDEIEQTTYYLDIKTILENENLSKSIDEENYQILWDGYRQFLKTNIDRQTNESKNCFKTRLTGVNNPQDETYVYNKLMDKLKRYNLIIDTINPFPCKNAFQTWINKAMVSYPKLRPINPNQKLTEIKNQKTLQELIQELSREINFATNPIDLDKLINFFISKDHNQTKKDSIRIGVENRDLHYILKLLMEHKYIDVYWHEWNNISNANFFRSKAHDKIISPSGFTSASYSVSSKGQQGNKPKLMSEINKIFGIE